MNKITVILLALCCSINVFSQDKAIAIAPSVFNVLYIGVSNPLDIAVEGINNEDISVTVSNGIIKKKGKGKYEVRVKNAGTATICVYSNEKMLGCKEFRCKALPAPYSFVISGTRKISEGNISRSTLLSISYISVELNSFIDASYKITSFSVSANVGGFTEVANSQSNKFTDRQKEIFRKVELGTKILIEEIKCVGPDDTVRKLNDITLKIK